LPNFTPICGNTFYYCVINTFFSFLSHNTLFNVGMA
jgi:hypothetical protein